MLDALKNDFDISLAEMRRIIREFHSEMAKGLARKKSSLKMLPAYVGPPTGNEKGIFLAIDLGGTNFRILEVSLEGRGISKVIKDRKYSLSSKYTKGSADDFFGFLASSVKDFIKAEKTAVTARYLGFTFSFPMEQRGIAYGILLRWTKGFNVKGVLGHEVVGLLNNALKREGLYDLKVASLSNDTVGTMIAKAYEDRDCDMGVILGTGTNACYLEDRMAINIEWGNFNKLKKTRYDKILDNASDRPGEQILEKMVSGMYLGEIARLVVGDLILKKIVSGREVSAIFKKPYGFKSEHISAIEGGGSPTFVKTAASRKIIKMVSSIITTRAARISAAAIAAVHTRMDPELSRRHTVAIDGSLYGKHPYFSSHMRKALRELLGKKTSRIKMALAKDGSGKGSAIIAAISVSSKEYTDE